MAVLVTCGTCQQEFRAKDQARGVKLKCPGCGTALTVDGPRVANHEVFLSYSHKDKSVADAVCAALENRKIRCWTAPRDIAPGGDWSASIVTAIEDARIMVLIFSSSSNMSQQVLREVERAVSKGLIVLPFRIESVDLSKSMEYFLSACHWMDAFTSPLDEHLKALTTQVKLMLLGGEPGETKPLGADLSRNVRGKIRGPQPRKPLMTLAAAAVVCLLIAGGLFAWHLSRGVRSPNGESESSVLPTTAPAAQASTPPPAIAADTPVRETATTKPEETVAAGSKGSGVLSKIPDPLSPPAAYPSPRVTATTPPEEAISSSTPLAGRPFTDLMPLIDVKRDGVLGDWALQYGVLVASSTSQQHILEIPYRPKTKEYDFEIVFSQISSKVGHFSQYCALGDKQFQMIVGSDRFGFDLGEKRGWQNETTQMLSEPLQTGRRYTSLVKVRKDGVSGYLDGKLICNWPTDYRDMGIPPGETLWRFPHTNTLGLAMQAYDSYAFFSMKMTELGDALQRPTTSNNSVLGPSPTPVSGSDGAQPSDHAISAPRNNLGTGALPMSPDLLTATSSPPAPDEGESPVVRAAPAKVGAFERKIRLACVGDGVTKVLKLAESYPEQLGTMLGDKWKVYNFGVPGTKMSNGGAKPYQNSDEFQQVLTLDPDVVLIMLGTNDTGTANWSKEEFATGTKDLIEKFKALSSKPRVFLCYPVPDPHASAIIDAHLRQEQLILAGVARETGATVIDEYSPLAGKPEDFVGAHPTTDGSAIIAATAYEALTGKKYSGLPLPGNDNGSGVSPITSGPSSPLPPFKLPQQASAARWIDLFNGKDLDGWEIDGGDPNGFSVQNGLLVAAGTDPNHKGYLLSREAFHNFKLRMDFMLSNGSGGAVAIRANPAEYLPLQSGGPLFEHPIIKLCDSDHWNDPREQTGTMHWIRTLMWDGPATQAKLSPLGDWNHLEVDVHDHSLKCYVNSLLLDDVTIGEAEHLSDGQMPALNRDTGRIGIQRYIGTVRYRNIQIQSDAGSSNGSAVLSRTADNVLSPNESGVSPTTSQTLSPPRTPAAGLRDVDLLKLVDPLKDTVTGIWTMQGGNLIGKPSGRMSRIEFPFAPPAEYDFRLQFVRTTGHSPLKLICSGPSGHAFVWGVAEGQTHAGFGEVDGKNPNFNVTTVTADQWIVNGQTYSAIVKVRAHNVEAWWNGKMITSYSTDFSDLTLARYLTLHHKGALGFCIYSQSEVNILSADVVEISGSGRLLANSKASDAIDGSPEIETEPGGISMTPDTSSTPPSSANVMAVGQLENSAGPGSLPVHPDSAFVPPVSAGQPQISGDQRRVDLLKLVDPAVDTRVGHWTLDGTGLHSSGSSGETIQFPYEPPAEYDYAMTFVRDQRWQVIRMYCSAAGHSFLWCMAPKNMNFGTSIEPNPTLVEGSMLPPGTEHTCVVKVRKSRVEAYLDGKLVTGLDTDYSNLTVSATYPRHLRDPRAVGLDFLRSEVVVKSAVVTEITGIGKVLRQPAGGP